MFYDCGWFLHGSQVAFNFLMEMPMKLPQAAEPSFKANSYSATRQTSRSLSNP